MPQISVIVPVYKVESYLHRCVDSILAQTFSDFELILVDDGSPDGSGKICDEYAEKDVRVRVIHKQNGGLSDARNAGIGLAFEHSDSEWLNFIDSDDWVHPQYLEYLYRAVNEKNTAVGACDYACVTEFSEAPVIDFSCTCFDWVDYYTSNTTNGIVAVCKLYKKELFDGIRYPVGRYHEDEFTTYKLLAKAGSVSHVPHPLYSYFQNAESITHADASPKRLRDAYDALSGQYAFAAEYGSDKLFDSRVRGLISLLSWNIGRLEASKSIEPREKARLVRFYRRKMCGILLKKRQNRLSLRRDNNLYSLAFPLFGKAYRFLGAAARKMKLRRVSKNG